MLWECVCVRWGCGMGAGQKVTPSWCCTRPPRSGRASVAGRHAPAASAACPRIVTGDWRRGCGGDRAGGIGCEGNNTNDAALLATRHALLATIPQRSWRGTCSLCFFSPVAHGWMDRRQGGGGASWYPRPSGCQPHSPSTFSPSTADPRNEFWMHSPPSFPPTRQVDTPSNSTARPPRSRPPPDGAAV